MIRHIFAALAALGIATAAGAQTEIRIALDGPLSAAHAGLAVARAEGLFAGAGLAVELVGTAGSRDALSRTALGNYAAAITDFSTLTEFVYDQPQAPVMGGLVIEDRAGHALIARRDAGIAEPADLATRKIGRVRDDEAARRLPNYASAMGLAPLSDGYTSFPDTAALVAALADGSVEAIAARAAMVLPELAAAGLGADALAVFMLADAPLYHPGRTLALNTEVTTPETAQALVDATIAGWQRAAADPAAAVDALLTLAPGLDAGREAARLEMVLSHNILTDWVLAEGIGMPFNGRLEGAFAQLQEDPAFVLSINRQWVLDPAYLPPSEARKIAPAR